MVVEGARERPRPDRRPVLTAEDEVLRLVRRAPGEALVQLAATDICVLKAQEETNQALAAQNREDLEPDDGEGSE